MASALEAPTKSGGGARGGGGMPHRRRLSVWLAEPLVGPLLAVLVDAAADARGGALLRALHEHAKHGDPATRATVERLLAAAAEPALRMVRRGSRRELRTRGASSSSASDPAIGEEDLWRSRYFINDEMRPPFISEAIAADVLRVAVDQLSPTARDES